MIDVPVFEPVTKKEMILNHLNAYRNNEITALKISELCGASLNYTFRALRHAGASKEMQPKKSRVKTDRLKALSQFYEFGFYSLSEVARMAGTSTAYARYVMPNKTNTRRGRGLYHLVDNLINMGWGFDRALSTVGVECDKYIRFKKESMKNDRSKTIKKPS
jgi:hypothetical protein